MKNTHFTSKEVFSISRFSSSMSGLKFIFSDAGIPSVAIKLSCHRSCQALMKARMKHYRDFFARAWVISCGVVNSCTGKSCQTHVAKMHIRHEVEMKLKM